MQGKDAKAFIAERTKKYPTNSYSVDINVKAAYSFLNGLYNSGKAYPGGEGHIVDQYYLIGNNCSTTVSRALNAGGMNIGIFQTPASLNYFLFNTEAIYNGYNPGLWGPKQ